MPGVRSQRRVLDFAEFATHQECILLLHVSALRHQEPSRLVSGASICSVHGGGGGGDSRARHQKKRQRMQVHRPSGSGEESKMPVMEPVATPGGTRKVEPHVLDLIPTKEGIAAWLLRNNKCFALTRPSKHRLSAMRIPA